MNAYATVDELAAALRITVTAANTPQLEACLDAAAEEIRATLVWAETDPPPDPPDPLVNRVNVLRGVEWFKANDAAFGVLGFDQTGAVRTPANSFARHAKTLLPLKQAFGVA